MRLTMLGTGHAMVTECYNTCFVLEDGEQRLLVDGGGGAGLIRQLRAVGLDVFDVREAFLTHKHLDHLTGIVWLIRCWCQGMRRGHMEGEAFVYTHAECASILREIARMVLAEPEVALIGRRVHLVEIEDGVPLTVMGHTLIPFDIHSTKATQFGFRLDLATGSWLVCCGDEPLPEDLMPMATGATWLLHEAFCCEDEAAGIDLARMHHSSVADACRRAARVGAENLVLYHGSDRDLATRSERWIDEGSAHFAGRIFVPRDLDVIEL